MMNVFSVGDEAVNNQQARMQMDYAINNGEASESANGTYRLEVERADIKEIYDIEASSREEAAKIAEKQFVEKYGKNTLVSKCKVHSV